MTFDTRRVVLAAAIALPLAAAATTIGLADDAPPPQVPTQVRIGESVDPSQTAPPPDSSTPSTTTTTKSRAEVVAPPPPLDDDDDDDLDDGADSPDDADDDD